MPEEINSTGVSDTRNFGPVFELGGRFLPFSSSPRTALRQYRYRDAPRIREPPAGDPDPFPIRPNPAGSEKPKGRGKRAGRLEG